ncbi:mycofactocin-coupled SDR family oxidoreductase [Frankia sp. AgB1.9]|uniref:mycofactocin-coupled SDR family oxidoreductase n=1 Tax=unclassified Frankia TaxID=2632575 RepID=UPI00193170CA|nr:MULTISPECIES: mycofactocin-coupled SDR family oxidoreductase [unclassified Frankia]MBL7490517.1 mycofactocin-coupled SDR family oxidoreductase [Frankia sp. AgW1.1]MBL7551077.1 mycofactocin-coupled SDR family oxidoreductase [Frankia sp. AgB1.9]MBL7621233.1 mycofactocin-coupled SDR family oxidoreductase [Frankia sp. AgB1.8]
MTGRLEGKVAFITGAARGQGRAHALRMAQEGADIIAVDICRDIASNPYPMSRPEDLAETERLVKETGRRIVARQGDVRERPELRSALDDGLREFGRLDILVAQAGILPMHPEKPNPMDFVDAVDVDLLGVMNAVAVSLPHLGDWSSIIITGSTAAQMEHTVQGDPGGSGYGYAKTMLMEYTRQMATHLMAQPVRVNCIHPTNVNTSLLHNELIYKLHRPDLENPTREDVEPVFQATQGMPIPYIQPLDVANLALFLASDEARYITGQNICVDAGSLLKTPVHSGGY